MSETIFETLPGSPAVQRQLLAQIKAREAGQPDNLRLMWRIAQAHRALGEFGHALQYYRAVLQADPGHNEARYFIALLSGEATGAPLNSCRSLAPPYLRFNDFLDGAERQALWQATEELLPTLHESAVEEYGTVGLNKETRRSHSSHASPRIREIFHQRAAEWAERHGIIGKLGIPHLDSIRKLQISLIAYGDGDYFKAHRDTGTTSSNHRRELTFVYHFFREPRRFEGGELYLYDAGLKDEEADAVNGCTCFEPVNNSIVFFPSRALHEVRPVRCTSTDPLDGRFAIAGWALRPEDTDG